MAYRPPTHSKWAPAEPMRRKPAPDADGWQTVGSKPAAKPANSKWTESALKKEAPAPSFEQEFPAMGSHATATATPTPKGLSMAERMKQRLAAEEEQTARKAEESRRKAQMDAEEYEKTRFKGNFVPLTSIMMARSTTKDFTTYQDPEEDADYYNEYPEHYNEDRAPQEQNEYDYEEAADDYEY